MSTLEETVKHLEEVAQANERKAFSLLGVAPGPGIDIKILPTNPCSASWNLQGATEAGRRFIQMFYPDQPIHTIKLAKLKLLAQEWGLSFETDWSCHIRTME